MIKWKCKLSTTKSAKKCIDLGHRDCLRDMLNKYDVIDIEKIHIRFNKNDIRDRYSSSSVDLLAYLCELDDFETVKLLIERYDFNPNNHHTSLRGYNYLLSSICYGGNYDIFLYIYIHASENGVKLSSVVYPCIYGNINILQYILNNLSQNDVMKSDLESGLFHAVSRNHLDIVRFLLENENYDLQSNKREDCVLFYAQYSNFQMWQYLVDEMEINVTKKIINCVTAGMDI